MPYVNVHVDEDVDVYIDPDNLPEGLGGFAEDEVMRVLEELWRAEAPKNLTELLARPGADAWVKLGEILATRDEQRAKLQPGRGGSSSR